MQFDSPTLVFIVEMVSGGLWSFHGSESAVELGDCGMHCPLYGLVLRATYLLFDKTFEESQIYLNISDYLVI